MPKSPTPRELAEAKKQRVEQVKIIQLCQCAWPVHRVRSGGGHIEGCPAREYILKKQEHDRSGTLGEFDG